MLPAHHQKADRWAIGWWSTQQWKSYIFPTGVGGEQKRAHRRANIGLALTGWSLNKCFYFPMPAGHWHNDNTSMLCLQAQVAKNQLMLLNLPCLLLQGCALYFDFALQNLYWPESFTPLCPSWVGVQWHFVKSGRSIKSAFQRICEFSFQQN